MMDSISWPIKVYHDISCYVFCSKKNKQSPGSKDIDLEYSVVRETIKDGHAMTEKMNTKFMIIDPLTEALFVTIFKIILLQFIDSFDVLGYREFLSP